MRLQLRGSARSKRSRPCVAALLGAACSWLMLAGLPVIGLPVTAHAFTEPRTYFGDPASGGGGGRFFTGSPAEGYGCDVCHSGPKGEQLELSGFPEQGYEPGASYELRFRWPALARRARELREEGDKVPSMGLVTDLVAESGRGAGTLELADAEDADERELCVLPEGQSAARLYAVRPGEPVAEQGDLCDAQGLGQRCVAAVLSCGAEELRMTWTAPARYEGTIWISAGLVATDDAAASPEDDAVTMLQRTTRPASADGDPYTRELHGKCSAGTVGSARSGPSQLGWLLALGMTLLVAARGAQARRARRATLCGALLLVSACIPEAASPAEGARSDAGSRLGLFAPGNDLGMREGIVQDAGRLDGGMGLTPDELRAIEAAIKRGDESESCVPYAKVEEGGTRGKLEIAFSTSTYKGRFTPENCGAVWIEDTEGQYVATPAIWAEVRIRNLFIWDARRCESDFPDVITSATLPDHTTPHRVTWNGLTHTGEVAPDGPYVLNIEVTEDEFNYGRRLEVPFEKGSEAFVLQPEDGDSVKDLVLTYTPRGAR